MVMKYFSIMLRLLYHMFPKISDLNLWIIFLKRILYSYLYPIFIYECKQPITYNHVLLQIHNIRKDDCLINNYWNNSFMYMSITFEYLNLEILFKVFSTIFLFFNNQFDHLLSNLVFYELAFLGFVRICHRIIILRRLFRMLSFK